MAVARTGKEVVLFMLARRRNLYMFSLDSVLSYEFLHHCPGRSCLMLDLADVVGRDSCSQIIFSLSFSFMYLKQEASNSDLIEIQDFKLETVNRWHRGAISLRIPFYGKNGHF